MFTRRSRYVVAVLAIGLTALTGCSTKGSGATPGGGGGGTGAVKTGAGVTADTITVGELTDLTGPFATVGKSLTQAQQLYFDQVNEAGGVCGRKVVPLVKDHAYNVQNAVTQYNQVQDRVLGLSQMLGSSTTAALLDQFTSDKVIVVPAAFASTLLSNKQIMMVASTYDYEMINLVDYALENKLINKGDKIGEIYIEGDAGANALQGAQYAASVNGLTVVDKKVKATDTDLTAQVTDLKNQGVTAIGVLASPTAVASVVGVDASIGLNVPVLGSSPGFAPGLLKTAAGPALQQLYYQADAWQQPNGTDPATQKFVADYTAKYPGAPVDGYVIIGAGAATAFTAVMKKACDNGDLTRDGMNTAFRSLSDVQTGVIAPLDYSKPGASPTQKDYIFRPDASQVGGLKEVSNGLYQGPSASGYTPPPH